jgi:hypothetical protein
MNSANLQKDFNRKSSLPDINIPENAKGESVEF